MYCVLTKQQMGEAYCQLKIDLQSLQECDATEQPPSFSPGKLEDAPC